LKADYFHAFKFLALLKFGKHKTTNRTLFNIFLVSELWMYCVPLIWQEQESLGHEGHLAALPGVLSIASVSVESWIVIFICSLVSQVGIRVHRTQNSAIYKST